MLRTVRLVAALAAVALVTAGCTWISAGHDGARTAWNPFAGGLAAANVNQLEVAWTATVPGAAGEALSNGGVVYVRSPDTVSAFGIADGSGKWSTPSLGGSASPVIIDDRVEVPTDGGGCVLVSLDSASGAVRTTNRFGPPDVSGINGFSSCAAADALAVGTRTFVSWYYLGSAPSPGCHGSNALGLGPGITAAGDPSGWNVQNDFLAGCGTAPPPEAYPPHYSAASSRSRAIVVAFESRIRAFPTSECSTCAPLWTRDIGAEKIVGAPALLGLDDVAVATESGKVVVIDGTTHDIKWTGTVGSPLAQPLALTPTTIFAAATNGTVAAFSRAGCGSPTCAPVWTGSLASPASARPSVGNDVLYVGSANGAVTAFPAQGCGATSCAALWSRSTGSKVTGAPMIVAGRVVVGSENGTVTAFARSSG